MERRSLEGGVGAYCLGGGVGPYCRGGGVGACCSREPPGRLTLFSRRPERYDAAVIVSGDWTRGESKTRCSMWSGPYQTVRSSCRLLTAASPFGFHPEVCLGRTLFCGRKAPALYVRRTNWLWKASKPGRDTAVALPRVGHRWVGRFRRGESGRSWACVFFFVC